MKTVTILIAILSAFSLRADEEAPAERAILRYEGGIGTHPGTLLLMRAETPGGEEWSGVYCGNDRTAPVALTQKEIKGDEILLTESMLCEPYDPDRKSAGWTIRRDGDRITGTLTAPDGGAKLAIAFSEAYPDGSARVAVTSLAHHHTVRKNGRTAGEKREFHYLQIAGSGELAARANGILRAKFMSLPESSDLRHGGKPPTPKDIEKAVMRKADLTDFGAAAWEETEEDDLLMNEGGILVVRHHGYSYTGGAHGNYGYAFTNLDLTTGAELKLADCVRPGFEKRWSELGAAEIRKQAGVAATAPLDEAGLFENKLELNDNWFVTTQGIGFCYNPYEIACYARGVVEFVLPWKQIRNDLKPGTPIAGIAAKGPD